MVDTPVVPAPVKRRLMDKSFAVASFRYNRWAADLDETQTLEDALQESFWVSVADKIMGQDKLNPKGVGDIIEIRKRDTGLFAEVIVVAIGHGFVKVAPLRMYEPKEVDVPESAPLATRWNPGRKCHEVIRKADKQVMHGGFQTRDDAVNWLNEHMKAMAA